MSTDAVGVIVRVLTNNGANAGPVVANPVIPPVQPQPQGRYTRAQMKARMDTDLALPVVDAVRYPDINERFEGDILKLSNLKSGLSGGLGGDPTSRPLDIDLSFDDAVATANTLRTSIQTAITGHEQQLTADRAQIENTASGLATLKDAIKAEQDELTKAVDGVANAFKVTPLTGAVLKTARDALVIAQSEYSRIDGVVKARLKAEAEAKARKDEQVRIQNAAAQLQVPVGATPDEQTGLLAAIGAVTAGLNVADPGQGLLDTANAALIKAADALATLTTVIETRNRKKELARIKSAEGALASPAAKDMSPSDKKRLATAKQELTEALKLAVEPLTQDMLTSANAALLKAEAEILRIQDAIAARALWDTEMNRLLDCLPEVFIKGDPRRRIDPVKPRTEWRKDLNKMVSVEINQFNATGWVSATVQADITANADTRETNLIAAGWALVAATKGTGQDAVNNPAKPEDKLTRGKFWNFMVGVQLTGNAPYYPNKGNGVDGDKLHLSVSGDSITGLESATLATPGLLDGNPAAIYAALFETPTLLKRVHVTRESNPKKHLYIGGTNGDGVAINNTAWGGDAAAMRQILADFKTDMIGKFSAAKAKGWKL